MEVQTANVRDLTDRLEGAPLNDRLAAAQQIFNNAVVQSGRQGGPKPPGFGSHIDTSKMNTPEARAKNLDVRKFNDFHHEIIRCMAMGFTKSDVCRLLKTTHPTINKVVNSPIGKVILAQLRLARDESSVDVRQGLKKLEPKALNVLDRALTEDDVPWSTRLKGAVTVIKDIAGYEAPKKVQIAHAIMTPGFIDQLKADAERAGIPVSASEGAPGSFTPAEAEVVEDPPEPDLSQYLGMQFLREESD